jgi:hypothetical protein
VWNEKGRLVADPKLHKGDEMDLFIGGNANFSDREMAIDVTRMEAKAILRGRRARPSNSGQNIGKLG